MQIMSHRFRVRAQASTPPARTGILQQAARWHSSRQNPAVGRRRWLDRTRTRAQAPLLLRLILNRRTPAPHRPSAALPTLRQRLLLKATRTTTTRSASTTSALMSVGRRMRSRMRRRATFQHTDAISSSASPASRTTRRLCTTFTAAGTVFELSRSLHAFVFYCSTAVAHPSAHYLALQMLFTRLSYASCQPPH